MTRRAATLTASSTIPATSQARMAATGTRAAFRPDPVDKSWAREAAPSGAEGVSEA